MPIEIFGLGASRPATAAERASCRSLVEALARRAASTGDFGAEASWIDTNGLPIYGGRTPLTVKHFEDGFVDQLRLHTDNFTGYWIYNIISAQKTASWTDLIKQRFPGDWPDWAIPAYYECRRQVPEHLICSAPLVCGEIGYNLEGRCINRDVIAYQDRVNLLHRAGVIEQLSRLAHPRILEIGGGYGGLAYFLTRFLPQASYAVIDIPSSLMFSGCYLTVAQATHPVRLWEPGWSDAGPAIALVPNMMADQFEGVPFDLAINTMSFAEMPAEVVRSYGQLIRRNLAPRGVLFEQNVDLDLLDQQKNFCTPARVLRDIFPDCWEIDASRGWGVPRLWSMGS